jgi:hypothetical protein
MGNISIFCAISFWVISPRLVASCLAEGLAPSVEGASSHGSPSGTKKVSGSTCPVNDHDKNNRNNMSLYCMEYHQLMG